MAYAAAGLGAVAATAGEAPVLRGALLPTTVESPVTVLSARRVVSAVTSELSGVAGGDGKRIGVATSTAAIRTTARIIRRGSMIGSRSASGDRVESPGPERMTARDTSQRQPPSAECPVALKRLDGVRGT